MLVSHRYQFIFIKTVKTAGTSIESYFEPYCMFEGEWEQSHARDEYISEAGIIGQRAQRYRKKGMRKRMRKPTYKSHIPAYEIRKQVGEEIWNSYFKFTAVRNPFDKLVSKFLFKEMKKNKHYGRVHLMKIKMKNMLKGKEGLFDTGSEDTEIERFRQWLQDGTRPLDRNKYILDGQICVDYFIRFECLHDDIKQICDYLSIPFEPERLPEFKKGHRDDKTPVKEFYDRETENIVRELYDWEIRRFGYDIPV